MNLSRWLIVLLLAAQVQATELPPLGTYQLVLLTKGPNAASAAPEVMKQHVEHLYKLHKEGPLEAAGPFTDDGEIQGILMFSGTAEDARRLEGADPAVKAGVFTMTLLPFLTRVDRFGNWAEFGEFEKVYFGFLVSGANRSQDAKTAERLQQEHLIYMSNQHEQGKLVLAGPFAEESNRRGIVVYRVATPEEAQQRANADPMVKAGRLAVELHPWQLPVGAITPAPGGPRR